MEGISLDIKRERCKSEEENSHLKTLMAAVIFIKGKDLKDVILALAISKIKDSHIKMVSVHGDSKIQMGDYINSIPGDSQSTIRIPEDSKIQMGDDINSISVDSQSTIIFPGDSKIQMGDDSNTIPGDGKSTISVLGDGKIHMGDNSNNIPVDRQNRISVPGDSKFQMGDDGDGIPGDSQSIISVLGDSKIQIGDNINSILADSQKAIRVSENSQIAMINYNNNNLAKKEKWIKHYSNMHKILLVGEGDFSFALCLATAFGSASNMVATSLDSEGEVMQKYSRSRSNLERLREMDCTIIHGVNVHMNMKNHFHFLLKETKFDRIVFNFPHAPLKQREESSRQIKKHQKVVKNFLRNACEMLTEKGEAHVTHKTTYPFVNWMIEELGKEVGLYKCKKVKFQLCDYPGYVNKRGWGRCDGSFPVGECRTFKFKAL